MEYAVILVDSISLGLRIEDLPIRYNNDKGGKPHRIRVFEDIASLFSLFSRRK